ncbi:MAG: CPBP family intramembrane glutamic endopeptidase [Caldilineaceae bacterium]
MRRSTFAQVERLTSSPLMYLQFSLQLITLFSGPDYTMVLALVYGELRLRTGSVWPAIILHWVGNTIANTLLTGFLGEGFVTLAPGKEYLGSIGAEGVLTLVLFGVLGIFLYRQRQQMLWRKSAPAVATA